VEKRQSRDLINLEIATKEKKQSSRWIDWRLPRVGGPTAGGGKIQHDSGDLCHHSCSRTLRKEG